MKRKIMYAWPVLGLLVLLVGGAVSVSAQNRQSGSGGRGNDSNRNRDDNYNRNNRNRDYEDDDDNYGRDDDYNRRNGNGSRNGGYYGNDVRYSIQRVKALSRSFQRDFDRALDNSRYDGRDAEDRINEVVKDFRDAASNLEDRYDDGRNRNNGANEARELIQLGNRIDRFLDRNRLDSRVTSQWHEIAQNLRTIGSAYGYNFNDNRGYGNNSRNRNDDYNRNRNRNRNDDDYNRNRNNRRGNNRRGF